MNISEEQKQVVEKRLSDFQQSVSKKDYGAKYEESKSVEDYLLSVFKQVGDTMLLKSSKGNFIVDSENEMVIRYLISYQCRWDSRFKELSQQLTGKPGDLSSSILMMGDKGVGKTLLMRVLNRFSFVTQLYSRSFLNTSTSSLLNEFRVRGDIDKFTYNIRGEQLLEGYLHTKRPMNACLHDLGSERDEENKQKVFGTDMSAVVNDFLMARYEMYQNEGLLFHITSNLDMDRIIKSYPPRVVDRFKEHNQLYVTGKSRRGTS